MTTVVEQGQLKEAYVFDILGLITRQATCFMVLLAEHSVNREGKEKRDKLLLCPFS